MHDDMDDMKRMRLLDFKRDEYEPMQQQELVKGLLGSPQDALEQQKANLQQATQGMMQQGDQALQQGMAAGQAVQNQMQSQMAGTQQQAAQAAAQAAAEEREKQKQQQQFILKMAMALQGGGD